MTNKISFIFLLAMFHFSAGAQQTYQLDTKKSKILWNTGQRVGGHYGHFLFNSGNLNYSAKAVPTGGSFIMDMNSVHCTDNPVAEKNRKNDSLLRTPAFLNAEKYPTATITLTKIAPTAKANIFYVAGELTIKGIKNAIEFTASIVSKDGSLLVTGEVEMHRFLWDIDTPPEQKSKNNGFLAGLVNKTVGDEVTISLNLVLTK